MKIYTGKRGEGTSPSVVDDVRILVRTLAQDQSVLGEKPLRHEVHHSPTGMQWGYHGSGPSDLARSILADHLGEVPEPRVYMRFKDDFVAAWGDAWIINSDEIDTWLKEREEINE